MNTLDVFSFVQKQYGYTHLNLKRKDRRAKISEARHVAFYMLKVCCGKSFPVIGRLMDRDHSAVHSGYHRIRGMIDDDRLDCGAQILSLKGKKDRSTTLEKAVDKALHKVKQKIIERFDEDEFGSLMKIMKALSE